MPGHPLPPGAALALTGVFGPAHKASRWLPRHEFLPPRTAAAVVSIRPRR